MKTSSRWIFSVLGALVVAGLIGIRLLPGKINNNQHAPPKQILVQSVPADSSVGLQDTAQKFLTTIEEHEPLDLLSFWSGSGVVLGVDSERSGIPGTDPNQA